MKIVKLSKFFSLILRHQPEAIGIELDKEGWADLELILAKMNARGDKVSLSDVIYMVENNDKQRFKLSEDNKFIRANQGHSVKVNLALKPIEPPKVLFHGTAQRFKEAILEKGLLPMSRQHVHLSKDEETALKVGKRHGKPILFLIDAEKMFSENYQFYCSENGVWLTEKVPAEYLKLSET